MANEKKYIVTASTELNIREGPGTDYEAVGTVPHGEKILSPDTAGWVPIILEDDTIGWVSGKYLQEAPEGEPEPEPEPGAPRVPEVGFPIFQKELTAKFGTPDYRQFARKNLTTIDLSEFAGPLAHMRTFDGKAFTSVYGHKLLAGPLKMALRLVCDRGLAKQLKTYDGCFNIRAMKSGSSMSVHSWGLALDFNCATNPFQTDDARTWPEVITDFSSDFVKCFAEAGFEWGGLWNSVHDAMHFQLPWTQDWQDSSKPLRPEVYAPEAAAEPPKPEKSSPVSAESGSSTQAGTNGGDKLAWGKKVSDEFRRRVREIADSLKTDPDYLMACMAFESGETFSPSIRNAAGSGATGLIQFMPSTAQALGTTTDELASLTAVEQLEFVEKYFEPSIGKLSSLDDVYMAILWPVAVGKPRDYVLFRQDDPDHPKRYILNAGLDFNQDGLVTKAEAADRVRKTLEKGKLPEFASA
jgi:D-alanyl-D-alanine carboxypeptidase/Bacterial SH3 domain/Transglycosylase SLT domain